MLKLSASETQIRLDCSGKPEFDNWCWVDYWHPVKDVVYFKKQVYQLALTELGIHLSVAAPTPESQGPIIATGKV
jgi:putative (di)nucleoside polyphosphate hydrolase